MAGFDGVFYLDACDIQTRVVTLEWSEIISIYNTSDTMVRDRRTKYVIK